MEFPDVGRHCDVPECRQLDYLHFSCDFCKKNFCKDHRTGDSHHCPVRRPDNQVLVCPLCEQVVSVGKNEDPKGKMDLHIKRGCKTASHRPSVYPNACSLPGCQKREVTRITCASCRRVFCLRHRLETDHDCAKSSLSKSTVTQKPDQMKIKPVNAIKPSYAGAKTITVPGDPLHYPYQTKTINAIDRKKHHKKCAIL